MNYNQDLDALEVPAQQFAAGLEYAAKHGYANIRVIGSAKAAKSRPLDLDSLNQHGTVQSLDLSDDIDLTQVDLSPLYQLKKLKWLSIPFLKERIDFSRLPTLETLYITGADQELPALELPLLKELLLVSVKNTDCGFASALKSLRELRISGGNIERLTGIETLDKLASIQIQHSPKMLDISAINALKHLQKLHVEKCSQLRDYAFLADNETLQEVFISELDSLAFAPGMGRLNSLEFWDLKDGGMSPLLTCKHLKEVYFHPKKKHYSHSLKELNAALG
ncbi:hypothetical protein [Pseudomonas sp. CF161]|uniref:hypothetical protein n=1 Tax=Pseudomonas sp. CF161 TaxID=911241 RepID=UPI000355216A|nr:hypothetical protein [Pseudomonas sp. CF161]EPL06655.1 hypothetical protein CF161_19394 [Pseudomonas sp. CF161]